MLNCKTRHDYLLYLEVSENVFPPSSLCHTIPLPIWVCHVICSTFAWLFSSTHVPMRFDQKAKARVQRVAVAENFPHHSSFLLSAAAKRTTIHLFCNMSRWLDNDLILFRVSLWTVTESRFVNTQKKRMRLISSHLHQVSQLLNKRFSNYYMVLKGTLSYAWTQRVIPSG